MDEKEKHIDHLVETHTRKKAELRETGAEYRVVGNADSRGFR